MTVRSPLRHGHATSRQFHTFLNIALGLLLLLAAYTLSAPGAALLHMYEDRFFGPILRNIMFAALPMAVFLIPTRIALWSLRWWPTRRGRTIGALVFGAMCFVSVDLLLKQGPEMPDLAQLLRHDTALSPISAPTDGVVGLKIMQNGSTLDVLSAEARGCFDTCRLLLQFDVANEVAILSSDQNRVIDRYSLADENGICEDNATPVEYRRPLIGSTPSMTLCQSQTSPNTLPMVVFESDLLTSGQNRDHLPARVSQVHVLSTRAGAMSQTVYVAYAWDVIGGGLLHPRRDGWSGDVSYFAKSTRRAHAVFDINDTGPFPHRSFEPAVSSAFWAMIAQTLTSPHAL